MIQVGSALLHIAVADTDISSKEPISSTRHSPNVFLHNINDQEDKLQNLTNTDVSKKVTEEQTSSTTLNKVLTTPAVRKLGKEYNINLHAVAGTGPKGRVLKADVLKILHDIRQVSVNDEIQPLASTRRETPRVPLGEDETVPIRGYNRLMCKTMTASLQIPHMCYADEINMNAVLTCRRDLKPIAESHGVKLSLLAFAIKAVSLAMTEFRVLNSSLDPEQYTLTYKVDHNIGVAMDTPRGLVVPVIRVCQNLSILEIAQELERLKQSVCSGWHEKYTHFVAYFPSHVSFICTTGIGW
jgi:pyruvate/2-oxoglutarate dehydrogenase complex dihydrolipoamide acyltransferase (E2) component